MEAIPRFLILAMCLPTVYAGPAEAQGLVEVLAAQSGSTISYPDDEVREDFSTQVRFRLFSGPSDAPGSGGGTPSYDPAADPLELTYDGGMDAANQSLPSLVIQVPAGALEPLGNGVYRTVTDDPDQSPVSIIVVENGTITKLNPELLRLEGAVVVRRAVNLYVAQFEWVGGFQPPNGLPALRAA
jgi:hypothetical protein